MVHSGSADAIRPVPQQRIIEKMNEYMSRRDYAGAQRHLLYWLEEAELGSDLRGQLMLRNELIGHYRKTGQKDPAMECAGKALDLIEALGMEETISAGTTYVNIATAYNAFGEYERSMEMFLKARAAYEGSGFTEPEQLGGLYNNMALTYTALGQYEEALKLYEQALRIMAEVPDGELEQAITYLNMANTVEAQLGIEQGEQRISELTERAEDLLEAKAEEFLGREDALLDDREAVRALSREMRARLGYYAFVCEKCAPVFSYYGYFLAAERFADRADRLTGLL